MPGGVGVTLHYMEQDRQVESCTTWNKLAPVFRGVAVATRLTFRGCVERNENREEERMLRVIERRPEMAARPARQTIYVVQPFEKRRQGRRVGLGPATPIAARDAQHAAMLLERQKHRSGIVGAVAFCRSGDPESGDYDDPVILGSVGELPEEMT
jgi:hypothetical protein